MTVYFAKTFHWVFTAVDRVSITSQLLYDHKIFCTMLFSIDVHWNTSPWNWRNCLLDVFLNAPWKLFYVNLPFERLFVTFWKLLCSHAITLRWLDDAKEFNQSGWSTQRDSCSLAQSWPRMLVASKAVVFLENYLAVSTWILNGSSIECLEKKYQPFSLAGVRFGSRVNQISGLKSA